MSRQNEEDRENDPLPPKWVILTKLREKWFKKGALAPEISTEVDEGVQHPGDKTSLPR